ncbi:reverse transcriptase [Gossypium australe]|uniref:Reverse transcriptase n=1 Tax=Gossypium australe TaxID=47621 RepID=A0A5B6WAT7_9ROSI|nr:reverse transcriptase [Gossypium australe]
MVFLMETKIDKKRMEKVRRKCGFMNGFEVEAEGSSGGLCLAWKEEITVTLRSFSRNHIDVMVKEDNVKEEWRFTGFYGSPYSNQKNDTWSLLRRLGEDQRDFNEILYYFEKDGGLLRDERKMEVFRETLEECKLEDIGHSGVWFTWERGNFAENNVKERLNRGVANDKWKCLFSTGTIHHLPQSLSDHCPLLLNTLGENTRGSTPQFKFEAWWILENSLEEEIKSSWNSSTGTIMEKLEKKREGLKKKLTKDLELLAEKERDDDTIAKIIETRINKDEIYWEQRARVNWLKVGDKNSSFFHKFATSRRKRNTISRLQLNDGGETSEVNRMFEVATLYFQSLFKSNGIGDLSHLLQGIKASVS